MKKILTVLFACSIVLAGCMDLTDEDIDAIVDSIVEIPGCNADETAYNYDVNATNNNACFTEMVLKNSIADFITLMDNGPEQNQTMGMSMAGSGDMEGQQMDWTSVNVYSPDGSYTSMELDMGMLVWSQSQLITSAADGTTLMQVNHNGAQMLMNSATDFSSWNSMDDDDMGDDDMDMSDNDMGGNDMDNDNMEMSLLEVEVPADFDPSTALFEAGLATDNGYSFSTTMDDGMGYSMTMTFTLGMDLVVNSMTLTETMDGESSTSSITMLEESTLMGYLTIDSTLPYQALPFGVSPMGGMDSGDDGMDDNGDDQGDSDDAPTAQELINMTDTDDSGTMNFDEFIEYLNSPDPDAENGDDESFPQSVVDDINAIFDNNDADMSGDLDVDELDPFILEIDEYFMSMDGGDGELFTCDNGNEVPADYVDDGDNDCGDWSDEPNHNDNGDDGMDNDHDDDLPSESEMFSGMDGNQDGYVNASEALIYFEQMMNDAPTPEDAMEEADYDDSGNISWNEFVINWNEDEDENDLDDYHLNNSLDLDSQLYQAFNSSDYDGSGGLNLSEVQDFIDQVVVIIETLEDDEDNDEFMSIVNSAFACTDYNADDMLDSNEFSAYYSGIFGEMNLDMMLCYMDLDQSGEVSASEFAQWANQSEDSEPMSDEDWNDFLFGFEMMDTDGSGGLNADELNAVMMGDGDDNDGHSDHSSMLDWMITNSQDMPMEGSFDDYTIVLAMCTMDESSDDGMDMGMGTTPAMNCDDDVLSVTIADAMAQDAVVMFYDADMSGTITGGDMVHISPDIDVDGDWNTVRLYSTSANSYSDENPMLTPGFTGALGMLALLGAALLTRRD
ncbi:MAG: hypothetical protein ISP82_00120 [Candidatus Poseidoniaceae archaeon]|nr:hypothetical protein [Candidatus Poseidoniaceae archaeon]